MARYRFEISANDFSLQLHYADTESSGLKYCKRYMSLFQRKVANVKMKVAVYAKEKQNEYWKYHGQPYIHQKNLFKNPLVKKPEKPTKIQF